MSMYRAGVGQPQDVADHRPHARAAGIGRDPALPRPVHDVPDDQEVGADLLVGQDLQLAVEPRANLFGDSLRPVPPGEPGLAQVAQGTVAVEGNLLDGQLAGARVERQQLELGAEPLEPLGGVAAVVLRLVAGMHDPDHRRVARLQVQVDLAAFRDAHRVLHRLRAVGEEFGHLGR
jgi:hypothetical protein